MPWNILQRHFSNAGTLHIAESGKEAHIARIAYFVKNGVPDDRKHPIVLGLHDGKLATHEGRHRLAAIALKSDSHVVFRSIESEHALKTLLPSLSQATSLTVGAQFTNDLNFNP